MSFSFFGDRCQKKKPVLIYCGKSMGSNSYLVELLQRLVVVRVNNLVNVLLLQQTSVSLTSTLARVGHLWEVQAPASVAGILTEFYFLSNFFLRIVKAPFSCLKAHFSKVYFSRVSKSSFEH